MVLLKYFGKESKEDWNQEADIVQGLSCGEDPHANLLYYRWHSKGKKLIYLWLIWYSEWEMSHTFSPKYRSFVISHSLLDLLHSMNFEYDVK